MEELSADEMAMWHAWKQASDKLPDTIMAEVTAGSGLSGPDFAVATRLVELGNGMLRQNELAASVSWHRSRLSHQLSRMEQRGLGERTPVTNGMVISITPAGRRAVTRARPLHAAAVRRHLIAKIPPASRNQLRTVLLALAGTDREPRAAPLLEDH